MWIVASSQSTSVPFIQIFLVGVMGTVDSFGGCDPIRCCDPGFMWTSYYHLIRDGGRATRSGRGLDGGVLAGEGGEPGADRLGLARVAVVACGQVERHRRLHTPRLVRVPEVVEQEGDRQHGRERVGAARAGYVLRAAAHVLEHAGYRPAHVQITARGQPDPAGDRGAEVGEDVAEQVVTDDHVDPGRL